MNNRLKGYFLGIIAAASYGTNPLFAVPLYRAGLSPDSVLFLRYLVAIPVVAAMILLRGRGFHISLREMFTLVIMGMLIAISSLSLFMSYNHMDVGIASTILFVYPILVAVIMSTLYNERTSLMTILCIILATAGIGLLMGNSGGGTISITGTLLVILSALTYAVYIVAVNKTSLSKIATLTVTFYVLFFGMFLFMGRLLYYGEPLFPSLPDWRLWGCVSGLAVFPTALSFCCTNGAIQAIGSTPTAILGAFEPVTAVIIGVCVFGETLTPRILVGLLLIIIAVILVIAGRGISAPLTHVRKMFPRLRNKVPQHHNQSSSRHGF